ncbi:MAG: hypothetical protein LBP91_04300 [Coriobacteriales bacterium]|nr:hypothetical protein [Coriobacteriales bacterium]
MNTLQNSRKKPLLLTRLLALLLAILLATSSLSSCIFFQDRQNSGSFDLSNLPETLTFASTDDLVTGLDAIQVMAKGINSDTGYYFDLDEFVAGKNTMIHAAFSRPVEVKQDGSMQLSIYFDGKLMIDLLPATFGSASSTFFVPRNVSDVSNWPAGQYVLVFSYGESKAIRVFTMQKARNIKVLAVPVIANYGDRVASCEGEWKTAIQFTRDCYPLANDGIEYILGNELDLSGKMYNLKTEEGRYRVWRALANLQTPGNDYELILGFVRYRQGEDGTYQGYTCGAPASIITESDGDMQPTVAHEIAHCYFVGDEYPGGSINNSVNPPPYGMQGRDFNDPTNNAAGSKKAVLSALDFGSANSGSIVHSEQIPANVTSMRILNKVGSFMGSGSNNPDDYWITSDIWSQLFKAYVTGGVSRQGAYSELTGENTGNTGGGTTNSSNSYGIFCPNCYNELNKDTCEFYGYCSRCDNYTQFRVEDGYFKCSVCKTKYEATTSNVWIKCLFCDHEFMFMQALSNAQQKIEQNSLVQAQPELIRVLDIIGRLSESGDFKADPWYSYEAPDYSLSPGRVGSYTVVMEDAKGVPLATHNFDVSFYTLSNPPEKTEFAPVDITVRFPENVATIKIMKGMKVVYSMPVSANAPEVAFVGIEENQLFSGTAEISWTGSDADGDTLYYELWYCYGDDEYLSLAADITETSYLVDFDSLPGTQKGYFYLYATDGVNTAETYTNWIQVDFRPPEIITTQTEITEYRITDEIYLSVDIYDAQDGWLYSDEVVWTLDNREFMTGSILWVYPYELTPGEHTFTLTATNSHGKTATKDFSFRVLDDESALPNDWSRQDIKQALSNGFIAPLYEIDAAITRGQFANLASTLYWTLWHEGMLYPPYEEGVVTDCGGDDYNQFLMVKLGLMEAPGGRFNPNGNLTEEEAAVILYRICIFALTEGKYAGTPVSEMIDAYLFAGVMDESGDNVYNAEENITCRLALVRCNRLYQFLFADA